MASPYSDSRHVARTNKPCEHPRNLTGKRGTSAHRAEGQRRTADQRFTGDPGRGFGPDTSLRKVALSSAEAFPQFLRRRSRGVGTRMMPAAIAAARALGYSPRAKASA